jgi:hypothetical protein
MSNDQILILITVFMWVVVGLLAIELVRKSK